MKELTEEEYGLIKDITSKTYLIQNKQDASHFVEVNPNDLFDAYRGEKQDRKRK